MTTTLPASIPGLLLDGTPILLIPPGPDPQTERALYLGAAWVREGGAPRICYASPRRGSSGSWPLSCTFLDLTDPTGMEHAKAYLAQNLGMDGTKGLLWYRVEKSQEDHGQSTPAHYVLEGRTGGDRWRWVFTEESSDDIRCAEYFWGKVRYGHENLFAPNGYTTVPGVLGTESDAEALRLSVLAVAGVWG